MKDILLCPVLVDKDIVDIWYCPVLWIRILLIFDIVLFWRILLIRILSCFGGYCWYFALSCFVDKDIVDIWYCPVLEEIVDKDIVLFSRRREFTYFFHVTAVNRSGVSNRQTTYLSLSYYLVAFQVSLQFSPFSGSFMCKT